MRNRLTPERDQDDLMTLTPNDSKRQDQNDSASLAVSQITASKKPPLKKKET